jgi:hypothetical protein
MIQCLDRSQEFAAYPRVLYNPAEIEYYAGKHYCLRNKVTKSLSAKNEVIEGIVLGHEP